METSKAHARRVREGFFDAFCQGYGIDIGVGRLESQDGTDLIVPGAVPWDKDNGDATFMYGVADGLFDFVYSSHCLEHLSNPYLAVKNWWRILRPGGFLILYVPHRDLYEKRTVLPSSWNADHKFFILPDRDEPPFTLGLLPLIQASLYGPKKVTYVRSCAEGHTIRDPGVHSDGEYSIEAVVQKALS